MPSALTIVPVLDFAALPVATRRDELAESGIDPEAAIASALDELGLSGVELLSGTTYLASVCSVLSSGRLPRLVERLLEDRERSEVPEGDPPLTIDYVLSLGVVLRANGETVARPGCCCDWGLLRTIEESLDETDLRDESTDLWMGHDASSLSIRVRGDEVHFTVGAWMKPWPTREVIASASAVREALDDAWRVIGRLESALRHVAHPALEGVVVPARRLGR